MTNKDRPERTIDGDTVCVDGPVALSLKLIQVPKWYIDYVVMHELCHLVERNHDPCFHELLDRAMPDWRERKRELDEYEFG